MKKAATITAVVAGHDHQNTLGVIRSLGEDGIRVIAVFLSDDDVCSTAYSKYIDAFFVVRPNELISTLHSLGKQLGEQVPLIPCGDDTAAPIAQVVYPPLCGGWKQYAAPDEQNGDVGSGQIGGTRCSQLGLLETAGFCRHREMLRPSAIPVYFEACQTTSRRHLPVCYHAVYGGTSGGFGLYQQQLRNNYHPGICAQDRRIWCQRLPFTQKRQNRFRRHHREETVFSILYGLHNRRKYPAGYTRFV